MRTLRELISRRSERRRDRLDSLEYAIAHARSESERNELIDIASSQGVFV